MTGDEGVYGNDNCGGGYDRTAINHTTADIRGPVPCRSPLLSSPQSMGQYCGPRDAECEAPHAPPERSEAAAAMVVVTVATAALAAEPLYLRNARAAVDEWVGGGEALTATLRIDDLISKRDADQVCVKYAAHMWSVPCMVAWGLRGRGGGWRNATKCCTTGQVDHLLRRLLGDATSTASAAAFGPPPPGLPAKRALPPPGTQVAFLQGTPSLTGRHFPLLLRCLSEARLPN